MTLKRLDMDLYIIRENLYENSNNGRRAWNSDIRAVS